MKAHLRNAKILAAKERDMKMIETMPEDYRPKHPIESTAEMHKILQSALYKEARSRFAKEKEAELEVYRRNNMILIENQQIGEK